MPEKLTKLQKLKRKLNAIEEQIIEEETGEKSIKYNYFVGKHWLRITDSVAYYAYCSGIGHDGEPDGIVIELDRDNFGLNTVKADTYIPVNYGVDKEWNEITKKEFDTAFDLATDAIKQYKYKKEK